MKRNVVAVGILAVVLLCSLRSGAQAPAAFKVAVFDLDLMVRALPEFKIVDSMTQVYERDSIGADYQVYQNEYQRLDSTYKADSALNKPKNVLDYTSRQRQQIGFTLVYWQQIAQNRSDQYRSTLSEPLYQRTLAAYRIVLATRKYNLILKPNSYEIGTKIDNLFPLVAKEMNVTLPPGLTVDPNQAMQEQPATQPKAPKK